MNKIAILALMALLVFSMLSMCGMKVVGLEPQKDYRLESKAEPSQMVVNDPHTFFEAVGGTGFDYASSMTQPVEGKPFAVTGFWDYNGVFDAFICEFDSSGGLNWARGLGDGKTGGSHCDAGTSVVETYDGGFVITGETCLGTGGDGDLLLAKFDSSGSLNWAYAYGGAGWDRGCSVIETSNGDLVVTGVTTSFGAGGWDVLLARFNSNGILLWARALGKSGNEVGLSVIEDDNEDLAVTGWTTSFGNNMDVLLAKFHGDGSFAWAKAFGGSGADVGNSVFAGKLGSSDFGTNIYVTGYTSSFGDGGDDLFVAKFDGNGNLLWIRTLGGTSDDIGCSLTLACPVPLASPTQIVVTGSTKSFGSGDEDVLVAAFDLDGNFKWARSFGGPSNDGCFSVKQALITFPFIGDTPGVRLFLAGYSYSWGKYPEDIMLASLDPYGDTYPPANVIQPTITTPALPPPNSFSPTNSASISTLLQTTVSNAAYPLSLNTDIFVTSVRNPPLVEYTDVGDTTKPVAFSFAIITDSHLNVPLLSQVVDWIKSNMAAEGIKFVMDLGDLTDQTMATGGRYNCIPANLLSVKAELDTLQPAVFYVPIIGNHDVWYYDNPSGGTSTDPNQSWFTKRPEEIFNQVFSPQYDYLSTILPGWTKEPTPVSGQPTHAPGSVDNYFQNFAFNYMGYHFICLDWVSRDDVYTGLADSSGTGWPDLQQWASGGTWDWFTSHLASYVASNPSSAENVLIFAHFPLSYGLSSLSDVYPLAFDTTDYTKLVNYLSTYKTNVDMWFSGHLHIPLEEDITDNPATNQGNLVLQTVGTAAVSPWAPSPINQNPYAPALRIVRVHSTLKVGFNYSPSQPTATSRIAFTDCSTTTSGAIVSWYWDFGDGTTSTLQAPPPKEYATPWIYEVTLTVEASNGLKGSIALTVDAGTTKLTSERPFATAYNNARKLVYDSNSGVLHLVYETSPDSSVSAPNFVTYAESTDEGATWFEVTPNLMPSVPSSFPSYPALDLDPLGKPCVVANWESELTPTSGLDIKRREQPSSWFSYDGVSASWPAGYGGFGAPSMVVGSDGTVHIAVSYSTSTSSQIRYYWASPDGQINGPEIVATGDGVSDCQFASIALDNNGVPQIVWQQSGAIYSEILYSYRLGPGSWSDPWDLTSMAALSAGPPSIAAYNNVLHVVWQESDIDDGTFVVHASSVCGTNNWGERQVASATNQAYPQVVAGNGVVYVVWADVGTGGEYDIFFSGSTDGGNTWSNRVNLSGTSSNSQYPQATIIPGNTPELCVVWTEGDTTYTIMSARYSGVKSAITNVTQSKTVVGQGYSVSLNATAENQGNYTQVFCVSIFVNTTIVFSEIIILTSGESATVTFSWNTTGFAYGNYTISAYALHVPDETNATDINFTGGTVEVAIPGDINGDGTVNILDGVILSNSFLATPSSSNWNPNADINGDNAVNILDAIILSNNFLQHYP